MTYKDAAAYMEQVGKKGSILGLTPVKQLLEKLSNPQETLSVIHVAGTNGKGSICTFLEAMYQAEGKRVGRYISPTLHCYLERFQINGTYMEEETFADLLSMVIPLIEEMRKEGNDTPTAFEIETVIAFLYFQKENVDIVILETGMGGREDATNVVSKPLAAVFASIGMDHMQFLGDTIEKIVVQKAGIMKKGCPAVIYPNEEAIQAVLKREFIMHNEGIKEKEMPLLNQVHKEDVRILSETLEESRFCYKGEEYRISMPGEYQIFNAVTAIETKQLLDGHLIKESLLQAHWEGRFEKMSDAPLFIKDGAHNVDGVLALKKSLQKHFTNTHFLFIIGVLKDKEYDKMMKILCPMADKVFTLTPPVERGLDGAVLKESILPYCKEVEVCASIPEAVERAKREWEQYTERKQPAVIVAWGSLSYIGQIKG